MSLHGFQSALAHVLRSYGQEMPLAIEDLTIRYGLQEPEVAELRHVLNQNGLKSYGEELFAARWHIIQEGLGFLMPIVPEKILEVLWEKNFEPKCLNIVQEELSINFLNYLINDEEAAIALQECAPYTRSLLHYAYCVFTFRSPSLPALKLAKNSRLSGRYFLVQDLDYDVRELFSALVDTKNKNLIPKKRPLTLLFVASLEQMAFRSFEIDQALKTFLMNELHENPSDLTPPACFDDLCALGLCKKK